MKKKMLSMLVGLAVSTSAFADDLTQIYELALMNDPVVNRAKADKDAAFEGIEFSRASLLPQISGSVDYSNASADRGQQFPIVTDDPDTPEDETVLAFAVFGIDSESINVGANMNLSIYDRRNWVNLARAEKVAQQSDTQYAASIQQLIVRVVTAYLDVLRAKDNLDFVRAEKRAIERQLEQTKQRFEVGLTAITDVHEAQANFDNTVAQEIETENSVELALESLRVITGKYHESISILDTDRFSATQPEPTLVDDWLVMAQEKNLELLVEQIATEIAMDDIKAARAGHYPTLDFNARFSRAFDEFTIGGNTTDVPALNSQSLGVSLSVPIYLGGSVTAQTAQAKYRYVSASQNREQVYRQTEQSVRSSYNDVKAAISRIRALEQAVVSADSALQATEAGFDVGTRTIVDVLLSTRNLFNVSRNLAGARYDFITAVINLKRAAGTLKREDVEMINQGLKPS